MKLFNFFDRQKISLKNIQAIIFDFDGIFTDNKVTVDEDGKESVICNRADGLGIKMLHVKAIPLLVLSTETNPVVAKRAQKLALNVIQGKEDKKDALLFYCKEKGIAPQNVMYVGNDVNDYDVMSIVGYPVAPKDAHPKIRRIAKLILHKKGGEGVIKELAENLIKS
ncbi:MAG TPA: haloacid dehalogenase [Firmicutes bacterium]|jgi:3-deoxy-D-manno-octulosonate 8-phosphate phosphatase (KDO 8-P phosphatase)|nr:haloacid dehalogenase [Bacillota bacterium]